MQPPAAAAPRAQPGYPQLVSPQPSVYSVRPSVAPPTPPVHPALPSGPIPASQLLAAPAPAPGAPHMQYPALSQYLPGGQAAVPGQAAYLGMPGHTGYAGAMAQAAAAQAAKAKKPKVTVEEREERKRQEVERRAREREERQAQARRAREIKAEERRLQRLEEKRKRDEQKRKQVEEKKAAKEEERRQREAEDELRKVTKEAERAAREARDAARVAGVDDGEYDEQRALIPLADIPLPAIPLAAGGPQPLKKKPQPKKRRLDKPGTGAKPKRVKFAPGPQQEDVVVDMETEEEALLSKMLKMGQRHGHKSVLDEDAVLNDAPLRARMLHVAAQHGVRLVHPGCVKACSLSVELYIMKVVQDMIRFSSLRAASVKDMPGCERDVDRNWRKHVTIVEEAEKEEARRLMDQERAARDEQLLAVAQIRRRGGVDEATKEQRREAKERAEVQRGAKGVAQTLVKILGLRRLGDGKKLRGPGLASLSRQRKAANVRLLPQGDAERVREEARDGDGDGGTVGEDGDAVDAGGAVRGDDAGVGAARAAAGAKPDGAAQRVLRMEDLMQALRHHPNYAHSSVLYKLLQQAVGGPL